MQLLRTRAPVLLVFLTLALHGLFPVPAHGATRTLWRIGSFDRSSREFKAEFDSSTFGEGHSHLLHRVGRSEEKDWPGFHPGSANGVAGGREHPYTVVFSLKSPPRGTFTLKISTLHRTPRRPRLRVEINGRWGNFFFRPWLTYEFENPGDSSTPHSSFDSMDVALPAGYFRMGENRLVLSLLDEPATAEGAGGTGRFGISGVFYDALSLSNEPARRFVPTEIHARAVPAVFYRMREGGLKEIIEVVVRLHRKTRQGFVTLVLNGRRVRKAFPTEADFGERRVEIEVPEWLGEAEARLRVDVNGPSRNFRFTFRPKRKWVVYIAPHNHLDVGYTDYPARVAEGQSRVIDQALELMKKHPDFRYTLDGSWNLEQYLLTRDPARQEEALERVREGRLGLPAQYANLLTGYASLETLLRSLYFSKEFARRHGLPFELASISGVPSYSGAYPSLLAAAGVKYWVAAPDNSLSSHSIRGRWHEKSPFYWRGPDAGKVLSWHSRHYRQAASLFGRPPRLEAIRDSLPVFLQSFPESGYKPDAVLIYGTQGANEALLPEHATFIETWNEQYAYPRLRYATLTDFMRTIEKEFGDELPTYSDAEGHDWEDGVGSDARFVVEDRRNQSRVLSAEILSTLAHRLRPELRTSRDSLKDIWRNLVLFAEHTWGAAISVSKPDHEQSRGQLKVKHRRVTRASGQIEELLERSMSRLTHEIQAPGSTLVVFNSLNWPRDELVETDLDDGRVITDLATRERVAFEILWAGQGYRRVRFLARDIPAVGYKCYALLEGEEENRDTSSSTRAGPTATMVENDFYRLALDPASGAVRSLYDKELGRELVDLGSSYKFNQYIYVTGGDGETRILRPVKSRPQAERTVHTSQEGQLVSVTRVPYGHSIRLSSSATNTPAIETEILLFDGEKRIEFINRVEKKAVLTKEGVYFAFPVAIDNPQFFFDTQTGWMDPARDLREGAGAEWFSVQNWMAVRDERMTVAVVPVGAPLAALGDFVRGDWPARFQPKSATLFSYIMNNYWHTNYRASQGGEFVFRYVVTSSEDFRPEELSRLAWGARRPVELDTIMGRNIRENPLRPLPAGGLEFLKTDASNVVLVTWKQAEAGEGTILRFLETAGRPTTLTIQFPRFNIISATLTNAVEDDLRPLRTAANSLQVTLTPHELVSLRVQFNP